MTENEVVSQEEEHAFTVITYEEEVSFGYTLPGEDEPQSIEHDLTFVWEDSLEKFIEEHGADREYTVHSFKREREQKKFLDLQEGLTDDLIEEVQEEIANKMKFGFEFSGQLHNDD